MRDLKFIISVAALSAILGTGTASAADLPVRSYSKAPAIAPVILYNWTGFYVGGNFGYSWGKADSNFTNTPTAAAGGGPTTRTSSSQNLNGALGGGQIGFNWQTNAFVWGAEADFQGTDQRKSLFNIDRNLADVNAATGAAVPGQAIVSNFDQRLNWFGTVRGRIGFLPDPRWLVYATGGFAYGQVNSSLTSIDPDGDAVRARWSENRTGWVVGAGVEAALLDNWTWKLEYLHVDLGRGGSTSSPLVGLAGSPNVAGMVVANLAINTRLTDEIVRLGANYRFKY
jgi:outer membrane immunogenic protein